MVWEDFARYLQENKRGIVEQFAALVRIEPKIETANHIPKLHVKDFLIRIIKSFAEELCMPEGVPQLGKVAVFARAHGRHRWKQGYRLEEVMREFAILRQLLMFHIDKYERRQLFAIEDRVSASKTLHTLLDEVMLFSVVEFAFHIEKSGQIQRDINKPDPALIAQLNKARRGLHARVPRSAAQL